MAMRRGDHIYTTKLQLSPSARAGRRRSQDHARTACVSASAFKSSAVTAPGSWLEIFGTNLSVDDARVGRFGFRGNVAPTSLDGVSVTIGGKNAYVAYVSPTQLNVLVPDGVRDRSGCPGRGQDARGRKPVTRPSTRPTLRPQFSRPLLRRRRQAIRGRDAARPRTAPLPLSDLRARSPASTSARPKPAK